MITAHTAALEIVSFMHAGDIASYTRQGWYDGVSSMLVDGWAHLDLSDVLDAVQAVIDLGMGL